MRNLRLNPNISLSAKHSAFPYQKEAFDAIKDLEYAAIFHEQGLGKTKIAIDLCLYWIKEKEIDTVLIVTKKQLVKNWKDEFNTHTFLKPSILDTDKGNNYYVFNSPTNIIITNFEMIESEFERVKLFLQCRSVAIIIDESTKLKNPTTKIANVFFKLSDYFKNKVIMTGTPVANRPYDIWAQIYFLDKGKSLGTSFEEFKSVTDLSNNLKNDIEARKEFEKNVSDIYYKLQDFSVRETKKTCGIELPEKRFETIETDFESKQFSIYSSIMEELKVEIQKDGEKIIDDNSESLKRLLRLNQVASNPRLIDDSYTLISGKEKALDNLIKDILNRNEKVIVWSSYIGNIDYFSLKYKMYGSRKIHGAMTIEERNKSVDLFKNDSNCKLLFATPQAAKEGLTLTVANNAIFYDRTFNLDDYLQAQDRIHRISQKKKCNIYNIVIKGSIDDWIDALLMAKQYAAELAQGDINVRQYNGLADYSYGDIIKSVLGGDLYE